MGFIVFVRTHFRGTWRVAQANSTQCLLGGVNVVS